MLQVKREISRPLRLTANINPYALGSVLVEFGQTKVQVTAMMEADVPPFLRGKGKGWVTAEYAMLPSSCQTRTQRERKGPSGRSKEIERLIGRSLRAAVDLKLLGERQIVIDCDVLVADGGTRTASITGGYVALALAIRELERQGLLEKGKSPLIRQIAALSVGIDSAGDVLVDLNYQEDSSCDTDFNLVMTKEGHFVELQGTAEQRPFSSEQLQLILESGYKALKEVFKKQDEALSC